MSNGMKHRAIKRNDRSQWANTNDKRRKKIMRLIVIPPYLNPAVNWGFVLDELVENYRKKGGLEGPPLVSPVFLYGLSE